MKLNYYKNSENMPIKMLRLMHLIFIGLLLIYTVMELFERPLFSSNNDVVIILLIVLLISIFFISLIKRMYKVYTLSIIWILWLISLFLVFLTVMHQFDSDDILIMLLLMMIVHQVTTNPKTILWVSSSYVVTMSLAIVVSGAINYRSVFAIFSYLFLTAIVYVKQKAFIQAMGRVKKEVNNTQSILENASEGFAVHKMLFDTNGKPIDYVFLSANKVFEEITGLKASEIIGKSVLEVLPLIEPYWIEQYGGLVKDNIPIRFINYSASFKKYFEVSAYSTGNDNFVTLFLDITDRMINDNKIKLAVKKVEKSNQSKSQFLRDVNHRLRTPLNGIMGMMQLIDYEEMSEDNRELFATMVKEAKNSKNIINQLSNYVNLQDYNYEISLNKIEDDFARILERFSEEEKQRIRIVSNASFDKPIFYESEVFKKILYKLLSNGLKYSQDQMVEVSITFNEETKMNDETNYYISVKDKGVGIDLELQPLIFNEFYHHDFINIYKSDDHLSLALCQQMAINIGGNIAVESYKDRGSKFTLVLPVIKVEKR